MSFLLFCTTTATAQIAYVAAEGRVSGIDTQTGQRFVSSGWNFPSSGHLAVDSVSGDLYVTDQGDRAIYRVNRTTGFVEMVSGVGIGMGPNLGATVYGIAIESTGSLVVVDGFSGLLGVVRIDRQTGNRTVLSAGANSSNPTGSGLNFQSPFGIVIESSGDLLITDTLKNAIIRVDHISGNRQLLSGDPFGDNAGLGPEMSYPEGIAIAGNGSVFICDSGGSNQDQRLIQINPTNGNRTVIATRIGRASSLDGGGSRGISGLAMAANGAVIAPYRTAIGDSERGGRIDSIDPVTGTVTTITSSGGFWPAVGTGPTFLRPIGVARDASGSIIVDDVNVRSLFVVNPSTGERAILPNSRTGAGIEPYSPKGIALGTNGAIVVVDGGDPDPKATPWPIVVQADPNTGDRTVLSAGSNTGVQRGSGSNFEDPKGIARESTGTFVVADSGSINPKIVRVDPISGNRTILSSSSVGSGTSLVAPYGIAVETNGLLIVTDSSVGSFNRVNAIIRIDPANGKRTVLSSASIGAGPTFVNMKGVSVLHDGSLAVADADRAAIFFVDPSSGDRTIISDDSHGVGANFTQPHGVAVEENGKLLVIGSSVDSRLGTIIRVDLATGNRTVVANSASGAGPLIQESPEFLIVAPSLRLAPPIRLANGTIQFNLLSPVGRRCAVDWSANLTAWTQLTNLSTTLATNVLTDAGANSQNTRFYRAQIIQ